MNRQDNIKNVKILLVDDKQENLYSLESLLEKEGLTFLKATSGSEALKLALDNEIGLILLDVQMPEMDGFEVARILKSSEKTRYIPIIFVTAHSKEIGSMLKGYAEGGIDYLLKPLEPEITRAKVDSFIKLYKQKKELEQKDIALKNLGLLVNNTADIMCILSYNEDLLIENANAACTKILGYETQELQGSKVFDYFYHKEDTENIIDLCKPTNGVLNDIVKNENKFKCKDGGYRWLMWSAVFRGGKWFVNAKDISEQKIAEENLKLKTTELIKANSLLEEHVLKLKETNKELDAFTYSVSHDLRAPLRHIISFSGLLEKKYKEVLDENGIELLNTIIESSKKLNTLIDDLLTLSRYSRQALNIQLINMNDLVQKIVKDLQQGEQEIKAKFIIQNLPEAKGDVGLLGQVFYNLISNAVKYSGKNESPLIEIGSVPEKSETIYYVKDNGVGFNMKFADKLFNVFQRLHSAEEFEGTGVGLSIVKRIIVKHGGRVWAESKINEGATFYFSLPKN